MDYQAVKRDLGELMTLLPPTFLGPVAAAIFEHKDHLVKVFPRIVELIAPHAKSGMIEGGAGIFDADEFERELWSMMGEMGITKEMLAQLAAPAPEDAAK